MSAQARWGGGQGVFRPGAALVAAAFPTADVDGVLGATAKHEGAPAPQALAMTATPAALTVGVAPNPVAGTGTLAVALDTDASVRVVLYDAAGREVGVAFDGALTAGEHRVALNASGLSAGVYVAHTTARGTDGGVRVAVRRFVVAH